MARRRRTREETPVKSRSAARIRAHDRGWPPSSGSVSPGRLGRPSGALCQLAARRARRPKRNRRSNQNGRNASIHRHTWRACAHRPCRRICRSSGGGHSLALYRQPSHRGFRSAHPPPPGRARDAVRRRDHSCSRNPGDICLPARRLAPHGLQFPASRGSWPAGSGRAGPGPVPPLLPANVDRCRTRACRLALERAEHRGGRLRRRVWRSRCTRLAPFRIAGAPRLRPAPIPSRPGRFLDAGQRHDLADRLPLRRDFGNRDRDCLGGPCRRLRCRGTSGAGALLLFPTSAPSVAGRRGGPGGHWPQPVQPQGPGPAEPEAARTGPRPGIRSPVPRTALRPGPFPLPEYLEERTLKRAGAPSALVPNMPRRVARTRIAPASRPNGAAEAESPERCSIEIWHDPSPPARDFGRVQPARFVNGRTSGSRRLFLAPCSPRVASPPANGLTIFGEARPANSARIRVAAT